MVKPSWSNVSSRSGSQSGQRNLRRKRWNLFPSSSNVRCRKPYLADNPKEFLPQDNATSSIYTIETLPSKRGYELVHREQKGRRKRRCFPLKRRSKNSRRKMSVSLDSQQVPPFGIMTDTLIQSTETLANKKETFCNKRKHSSRGRRGKGRSRISVGENDQDHCRSSDQNMSSGLNYKQNRKRRRSRSSKRMEERRCDIQWIGNSTLQSQDVYHASVIKNLDEDIGKCSKQSENNLDTVNSHVGERSKQRKMSRKCKKSTSRSEVVVVENHSLEISKLRCISRKKLLVLDLNGILCDVIFGFHGTGAAHKKVNRRSVFKRPFLDDFLTFCFETFVVGIWSSRNKKNIDGVIDYIMGGFRNKLLFCWDQSKCTPTGFSTIEDRHKPLFLKEMIKLWNKEEAGLPWEKGDYMPSNTMLVDDSPYKALCNPPYTAVFPFSYDFRKPDDSSLGPGGDIRVFLEGVAEADDVQEYVKEHPFGQQAITSEHEMWNFYRKIAEKNYSMALTY